MKFDLIISNPPYNRRLDLKILDSVIDLGEKICFVHPCDYIFHLRKFYQREETFQFLENSTHLFNIACYNLAIHLLEKGNLKKINFEGNLMNFSDETLVNPVSDQHLIITRKVQDYLFKDRENNLFSHIKHTQESPWWVSFPWMITISTRKYKILFSKENRKGMKTRVMQENLHNFGFAYQTQEEAIQMEKLLKSKLFRFLLLSTLLNFCVKNLFCSIDEDIYEKPHTLQEQIGLTDEELEWIKQQIPDYYGDEE